MNISIKMRSLIKKIKKFNFLYVPLRKIYYFLFFNKTIGKLLWIRAHNIHAKDLIDYEPCLCGNKSYYIYLDCGKHKVISCSKCNLSRNFPKPPHGIYEKDDSIEYENSSDVSIQIKEVCNELKNNYPLDINIIDFGCGDGRYMSFLKEIGFKNVYGLEISNYLSKKAKDKKLDVFTNINDIPKDLKFDCVFSICVFEHVERLNDILSEIKRIIKDEALLVAFVPNIRAVSMRNIYQNLLWNSHYWQFNPTTLSNVLEKNYFKISKCQTMSDKQNRDLRIDPPSIDGHEGDIVCIFAKNIKKV